MRRFLTPILFGLLVLVDVVIVYFAMHNAGGSSSATGPDGGYASTTITPAPSSSSSAVRGQSRADGTDGLIATAQDSNIVWRARTDGTCTQSGPAKSVSVSTDGGKKFTDIDVPLSAVSAMWHASDGSVTVFGANTKDCAPAAVRVDADSRKTANSPERPAWAVSATDRTKMMHAGKAVAKKPCGQAVIADVAAETADAVNVLCSDHRVVRTGDAGEKWTLRKTVPSAVAIGTTNEDIVYVLSWEDCGYAVLPLSDAAGKSTSSCIKTKDPVLPADLTILGDSYWVVDMVQAHRGDVRSLPGAEPKPAPRTSSVPSYSPTPYSPPQGAAPVPSTTSSRPVYQPPAPTVSSPSVPGYGYSSSPPGYSASPVPGSGASSTSPSTYPSSGVPNGTSSGTTPSDSASATAG